MFLTVPQFPRPEREVNYLANFEKGKLNFEGRSLATYTQGDSNNPLVLLIHGWAGRGTQFGFIAEQLVNAGYFVATIDMPGHGDSEGKRSSFIQFQKAILAFADEFEKPVHAIVAHSVGGVASMLAETEGLQFNKLVMIGTPSDTVIILDEFAEMLNMSGKGKLLMQEILQKRFNRNPRSVSGYELVKTTKLKGLLIHDKNDHDVPFTQAEQMHKFWEQSELMLTEKLGHRKILGSKEVADRIVKFLA